MLQLDVCFFWSWLTKNNIASIKPWGKLLPWRLARLKSQVPWRVWMCQVRATQTPEGPPGRCAVPNKGTITPKMDALNLFLREFPPNKNLKQNIQVFRKEWSRLEIFHRWKLTSGIPFDFFCWSQKSLCFRGFQIFVVEFPGWKIL